MFLFPRVTLSTARNIAESLGEQSPSALRQHSEDDESLLNPQLSFFAPTGGMRADLNVLRLCRQAVRAAADQLGFPNITPSSAQAFDVHCAIILYEQMRIGPAEASAVEVWSHMTCIMMPDIVRWRYQGVRTPQDRFIGSGRGVRKNTFGRLWWRARLFRDQQNMDDPYMILKQLGEDDHVQITERPTIAGNALLARQIAVSLHKTWGTLKHDDATVNISERDLLRDTMKRIRRRMSITAFDLLDDTLLALTVDEIFASSVQALQKSKRVN